MRQRGDRRINITLPATKAVSAEMQVIPQNSIRSKPTLWIKNFRVRIHLRIVRNRPENKCHFCSDKTP